MKEELLGFVASIGLLAAVITIKTIAFMPNF